MSRPQLPIIPGYEIVSKLPIEQAAELWKVQAKSGRNTYFTAAIVPYDDRGRQLYRRAMEVQVEGLLRCVNVLLIENETKWCFLYEFAELGSLIDLRRREAPMYEEIQHWLTSLSRTVLSLHSNGFMHRGIHPANIFFHSRTDIRLGNFLHVRDIPDSILDLTQLSNQQFLYLPPECSSNHAAYDEAVDVWGLGCVGYYMYYGKIVLNNGFLPARSIEQIRDQALREFISFCCMPKNFRPRIDQLFMWCELLGGHNRLAEEVAQLRSKIREILEDVKTVQEMRSASDAKIVACNGLKLVLRMMENGDELMPIVKQKISAELDELRETKDRLVAQLRAS